MGQTAADGMRGVGPSDKKLPPKIVLWLVVLWRVDAPYPHPSRRPLSSVAPVGSGWLVCKINF